MRLIKMLGLAMVVAIATMAFIGAGSAAAQDKIVLCKELIEKGKLCPEGKEWPKGSLLLFLAKEPEFKSSATTVKCEDSVIEAKTLALSGSPLSIEISGLVFGKLPTPTLGEGCTGCTKGIHAVLPINAEIEVTGEDDFWMKTTGLMVKKGCPLGLTCVYGWEGIKSLIEHKGTHPSHEGSNLPSMFFEVTLTRQTTHGGSSFCPATGTWTARYVAYLVNPPAGEPGLGWPALSESEAPPPHVLVVCKELVEQGGLCGAEKAWPSKSKIVTLASSPELKAGSFTIKCEDSLATVETLAQSGASLPIDITELVFGVLPTPELGAGCTECDGGIHPVLPMSGELEVTGEDDFWLKVTGLAVLLSCPELLTCVYRGESINALISHNGKHSNHTGTNLLKISFNVTLNRVTSHGGSSFCPATSTWIASYVITLVTPPSGESGLGWVALLAA
jgi:hypothetical protein